MKALLLDSKRFLALILIACSLGLLDFLGLATIPRTAVQFISTPIQFGLYQTSLKVNRQLEFIVLARRASQERKALAEQLAQTYSEISNLRRQLAEAQAVLAQQGSLDPLKYNLIEAHPIGYNRFLKIDKGADDGIKIKQAVVFKDNLLGEVINVSPKQSEVMLITDNDSKIAAFVSNSEGKAKGILIDQYGELLMDKILHEEKIAKDDLVYSDGTENLLPRGLILGRVIEVLEQENQNFKKARINPVFDVKDLDLVFVIKE